jgi:hypothetical protein
VSASFNAVFEAQMKSQEIAAALVDLLDRGGDVRLRKCQHAASVDVIPVGARGAALRLPSDLQCCFSLTVVLSLLFLAWAPSPQLEESLKTSRRKSK